MTVNQVRNLRDKLFVNAASLLSDAQLLLEAGRFPRVYSLSVLALEELGKIGVLLGVSDSLRQRQAVDWQAVDRILHSHRAKLVANAMAFRAWAMAWKGQTFDPSGLDLQNELKRAAAFDTLKQDGFYVRVQNGTAIAPNEEIHEELARGVFSAARRLLPWVDLISYGGDVVRDNPQATKENPTVIRLTHSLLE